MIVNNGGRMKISLIAATIVSFGSIVWGGSTVYGHLDQSQEVLSISERISLHSFEAHSYHLDDMNLRILYLEAKENITSADERELRMYKVRKDKIVLLMENFK